MATTGGGARQGRDNGVSKGIGGSRRGERSQRECDGGATRSRKHAATMAWPRRRPEVGEEVVSGREMEMPGSEGDWWLR